MKILYIIKQTNDAKISANIFTPNQLPGFFKPSDKIEIDHTLETLQHIIKSAKALEGAENKPAVKTHNNKRFYFIISGKNAYGFVTDTADSLLGRSKIDALFDKIKLATDTKQLQQLIADPEKATETKIDIVNKQLTNVKGQLIENIDKVIERGEKIDLLSEKSKNIHSGAVKFKKGAADLKYSQMSWFSRLFQCISYPYTVLTAPSTPPTPKPK